MEIPIDIHSNIFPDFEDGALTRKNTLSIANLEVDEAVIRRSLLRPTARMGLFLTDKKRF